MSIATAVLADAPLLYWKLDDPTGPAASDSSGNGNAGAYGGDFLLAQNGPEAGTGAVLFFGNGTCEVNTPALVKPWSLECWFAIAGQCGSGSGVMGNIGPDPLSVAARGDAITWTRTAFLPNVIGYDRAAIGTGDIFNIFDSQYHQVVYTHDAADNVARYFDGAPGLANGGNVTNALVAGDKAFVGPGIITGILNIAHFSLYGTILSAARVAAHFAARVNPQEPIGSPIGLAQTLAVVGADLSTLIRYVSRTYQNSP